MNLVTRVLLPLAQGGDLVPLKPIGARLALEATAQPLHASGPEAQRLERARLLAARRLFPLDELPPMTEDEWRLACAFNDLLQAAHPDLPGIFGTSRPMRLLHYVDALVERVGPPQTLAEALGRHVTFRRATDVARTDTLVKWWTGKKQYVGQHPSGRLTAWPSLRRVRVVENQARLPELLPTPGGHDTELSEHWLGALSRWLDASPVTRLARAAELPFSWSPSTLRLVVEPEGRRLALRAIDADGDPALTYEAIEAETQALEERDRSFVRPFLQELGQRANLDVVARR